MARIVCMIAGGLNLGVLDESGNVVVLINGVNNNVSDAVWAKYVADHADSQLVVESLVYEIEPVPEPEPDADIAPEVVEPVVDPVIELEPEPEPVIEPAPEVVPDPIVEPVVEPIIEPEPAPVADVAPVAVEPAPDAVEPEQ